VRRRFSGWRTLCFGVVGLGNLPGLEPRLRLLSLASGMMLEELFVGVNPA
jgi:hypothetical protein